MVTQAQINQGRELNQKIKSWEMTAEQATQQMKWSLNQNNQVAYDPSKLQNANVNLTEYGDDSSEDYYNNPELWWWTNSKYEWANTQNTFTQYDPNATLEWLDPNYQFGQSAQMMNSQNANYIANRNDQIASALYNAWRTSIQDVANYLNTQPWFQNSTENERKNTVASIWKRIGQIKGPDWETQTDKPAFGAEQAQEWKIYGRELGTDSNGSDFAYGENTLTDPFSVEAQVYASRQNNYKSLQRMDSYDIANLMMSGITPFWDQAIYDLQEYDPVKYKEIQWYMKEMKAEGNINALSHGSATVSNDYINEIDKSIKNSEDTWIKQNSDERSEDEVRQNLNDKIDNNLTALTAKQQMMQYKDDIVDLQYELDWLPKEAKKAFKWDVPEYIYKAYIANRQQEIQSEMEKLESKYNAMVDMYKLEVSQMQREEEMNLKRQQLALQQTNAQFDMWYKSAQLEQNQVQWAKDSKWNMKAYKIINGQVVQVDDGTAYQWYVTTVSALVDQANQMADLGAQGWQCEAFTDNLAEKAAWVRMVWLEDWANATTAAEKAWYATQFWTFSDYIPEVWDVAVFTNNWTNWVSKKRWHTMYVTWYDPNTGIVTLVWSNNGGDKKVYTASYNLQDFYAKWWQGFRNPYKYAQWQASVQSIPNNTVQNPMENIIDNKIESGELNATQTTNISKFGFAYENLWRSKQLWELDSLLQEWAAARFFQELSVSLANTESGQSVWKKAENIAKMTLDQFIKQVEIKAWQQMWNWSSAYMWFMSIVNVIEQKLRKESGAAINGSERAMDFLQYLPQAGDNEYAMNRKLENLEIFLKYWAKEGGITNKEYVPILSSTWRDIE